jgi:hypothetical protein
MMIGGFNAEVELAVSVLLDTIPILIDNQIDQMIGSRLIAVHPGQLKLRFVDENSHVTPKSDFDLTEIQHPVIGCVDDKCCGLSHDV